MSLSHSVQRLKLRQGCINGFQMNNNIIDMPSAVNFWLWFHFIPQTYDVIKICYGSDKFPNDQGILQTQGVDLTDIVTSNPAGSYPNDIKSKAYKTLNQPINPFRYYNSITHSSARFVSIFWFVYHTINIPIITNTDCTVCLLPFTDLCIY